MKEARRTSNAGLEREAALMIVSADPSRTARRIATLRRLGDYALVPRATERFRDTYLDTPGGELGAKRIALRIRDFAGDGPTLTTLKSPGRRSGGVATRGEIEVPLDEGGARRVLTRLQRLGVRAPLPSARDFARGGAEALLPPSQVRTNRRQVRDVTRDGRRVAELAIDHVVFHFGGEEVRLEEVEIEAKDKGTARDVERIARTLLEAFADDLRPWSASKLATGKALEAWSRKGQLAARLTRDKTLSRSWISSLARAGSRS